jgi:hypothetical protein
MFPNSLKNKILKEKIKKKALPACRETGGQFFLIKPQRKEETQRKRNKK